MSALRIPAAVACVAAAALLAGSVARGGEPPQAPAPAAEKTPKAPAPAHTGSRPESWAGPERPRVTPGILVRAAKRAQQRDAATCGPCAARSASGAAQGQGVVESIEIDWHAASATP